MDIKTIEQHAGRMRVVFYENGPSSTSITGIIVKDRIDLKRERFVVEGLENDSSVELHAKSVTKITSRKRKQSR